MNKSFWIRIMSIRILNQIFSILLPLIRILHCLFFYFLYSLVVIYFSDISVFHCTTQTSSAIPISIEQNGFNLISLLNVSFPVLSLLKIFYCCQILWYSYFCYRLLFSVSTKYQNTPCCIFIWLVIQISIFYAIVSLFVNRYFWIPLLSGLHIFISFHIIFIFTISNPNEKLKNFGKNPFCWHITHFWSDLTYFGVLNKKSIPTTSSFTGMSLD